MWYKRISTVHVSMFVMGLEWRIFWKVSGRWRLRSTFLCHVVQCKQNRTFFFYVLLTVHPNIMIVFLFPPIWCTNSLFQYIYYIPLHVSSTIMLIFRRTIVLTQYLVSSLSLSDCTVHRLREVLSAPAACVLNNHLQSVKTLETCRGM